MWTRLYSPFTVKENVHFRFTIRLVWTDSETGSRCLALVSCFSLFVSSLVQLSLSMNYAADTTWLGPKDEVRIGLRVETTESWTGDLSFVSTLMCRREAGFIHRSLASHFVNMNKNKFNFETEYTPIKSENRKRKWFLIYFPPFRYCRVEVPEKKNCWCCELVHHGICTYFKRTK